jgi:4-carboxymuconolactone decarboxylase
MNTDDPAGEALTGDRRDPIARVDLIAGSDDLTPEARTVVARLIESRGEVSRPFQLLLHSPALAGCVAELGHLVRSGSSLGDADRELVTLATGRAIGCAFVWDSHLDAAAAAGVSPDTIATLQRDPAGLGARERVLVSFVEQLCEGRTVANATFEAARELVGARAVVELSLTIGYYSMLGSVMGACDAC